MSHVGRFYDVRCATGTVDLKLEQRPLPPLAVMDGMLVGEQVQVSNRGVCVEKSAGALIGVPVPEILPQHGRLLFDPAAGGVRTRDNRLAGGAWNQSITEATHFGMVNAFVHATRAVRHVNALLLDLGHPVLPVLPIVVSAHSGSRLAGFSKADGDFRSGRMRPLAGGHYRLSQRTTGVPEPVSVLATGEVHLGPGRIRQRFRGQPSYLRAAAHNPATIYHEVGHHVARHTADFRLNAERKTDEQRNGKPGVEEGWCDYLAAALLGTGRPYGWYRAERGVRRDPASWSMSEREQLADPSDVYAVGARWAALWWRCRERLADGQLLDATGHDRVLLLTLLALGEEAGPGRGHGGRAVRERHRGSTPVIIEHYLAALRQHAGASSVDLVADLTVGVAPC